MVRVLGPSCVAFLGLAACYSPAQPNCGFICGPGGACPDHYACNSNGQCQRIGAAATACDVVDAGIGNDGIDYDAQQTFDADVTPPMLSSIFPGLGTTTSDHLANVYVYFTENVYNVTASTFLVSINGSPVAGQVYAASLEAQTAWQFQPNSAYPASSQVDVVLTAEIYDFSGNPLLGAPLQSHFFTGP